MTLFAEHYDFAISLLLLDDVASFGSFDPEPELDAYDKMLPKESRREW